MVSGLLLNKASIAAAYIYDTSLSKYLSKPVFRVASSAFYDTLDPLRHAQN